VVAPAARAHVEVLPAVVAAGDEVVLSVELPRLRPGSPPTGLTISGAGLRQLSVSSAGRAGAETRWRVRVAVEAEPGPLPIVLTASFADGRSVDVRQALTVVPARRGGSAALRTLALVAALAAVGAAAAAVALRTARRPA
jgi:hypothetical protein